MTNYLASAAIQQFSITIASGALTGTASINAVGSGAFILWQGINPTTTNPADNFAYLSLTNSTTITATRNTASTATPTINGCIVDGDTTNLIKSVQYGTVTIVNFGTSGTATISSITNNNAAIHLLGWSSTKTTYSCQNENPILSLSGTTVTASRAGSSGELTVGFVVIEFQGTALNQAIQNVSATSSGNVTSYTATISSVNINNTICIYAGTNIAVSGNESEAREYGVLTNATTFTANVNTAFPLLKTFNCSIIEFIPGLLRGNVQRGTTTLTGVASNNSTITGVTQANSLISWLGNSASVGTPTPTQSSGASAFLNNTTIIVTKNSATSNITGSWEVADFSAPTTYNNSLSETITSSDSESAIATDITSLSETATSTDSYFGGKAFASTVSETITSSDSYIKTLSFDNSLSETITSSDSLTGSKINTITVSESINTTDANVGRSTNALSLSETDTSSDSLLSGASYSNIVSESLAANDNYGSSQSRANLTTTGSGDDKLESGNVQSKRRYDEWRLKEKENKKVKKPEKPKLQPPKPKPPPKPVIPKPRQIMDEIRTPKKTHIVDDNLWKKSIQRNSPRG